MSMIAETVDVDAALDRAQLQGYSRMAGFDQTQVNR